MKRPSLWPMLMILMAVAVSFALLLFHDRTQRAEAQTVEAVQQVDRLSTRLESLSLQLDDLGAQLAEAQQALQDAAAEREAQRQQTQALEARARALEEAAAVESPDTDEAMVQNAALWTISLLSLVLSVLQFILQ